MLLDEIKRHELEEEDKTFSKYACKSKEGERNISEEEDFRLAFSRDADRILHSLSYTRYMGKTQVFSYNANDNVSKRMVHVQFVSKIARTIGKTLNLNVDLIEAMALGHDIGHTPLGHLGESILNKISLRELNEYFMHNVQSVRQLLYVDHNGEGTNLTYQVLDGILCHNGEIVSNIYEPVKKTKEEFFKEYEACYKDRKYALELKPGTLEGCVVRISDIIAYIGRDIEDAIKIGVFKREELPPEIISILGSKNSSIINTLVLDIVENSYNKPYIMMSDKVFKAVNSLKAFNYINIYDKANTKEEKEEYEREFNIVFSNYMKDLEYNNKDSSIYKVFLKDMTSEYLNNTVNARKVIDFIAGMTDIYFKEEYEKISKKNA